VDVDRCRATVNLHEPLRRSFSTWLGGNEVAEVHSCVLQGGHHGEHLAAADPGGGRCWFRWDDSGFSLGSDGSHLKRRGGLAGSPRHAGSAATSSGASAAASTTIPTAPPPRRGRHASDASGPYRSSESRSPTEALWALATAIGRLADVIAAASAPTNPNGQAN
jgi:hypothetical protein